MSVETKQSELAGNIILFSGCLDPQTSADSNFSGKWVESGGTKKYVWGDGNGAFTWYMLQALQAANYNISCNELLKQIVTLLKRNNFTQETMFTTSKPELFTKPFSF